MINNNTILRNEPDKLMVMCPLMTELSVLTQNSLYCNKPPTGIVGKIAVVGASA